MLELTADGKKNSFRTTNWLRFLFSLWRNKSTVATFREKHPHFVPPDPKTLFNAYNADCQKYFEGGLYSARWIRDIVSPYLSGNNWSVLEWGCGQGYIIQHMPEVLGDRCQFYATEDKVKKIQHCIKNIPGVEFTINSFYPPLKFDYNKFDLLYGINTLLQVPEQWRCEIVEQFYRVMKPGAVLLLTVPLDDHLNQKQMAIKNQFKTLLQTRFQTQYKGVRTESNETVWVFKKV